MIRHILKAGLAGVLFLTLAFNAFGQTQTVSGTVTNKSTGEPLPGVNILIKGTSRGAATNAQGEYQISVEPGAVLLFRAIGYKNKEITVGTQTTINVAMEGDVSILSEIVVTGYTTQLRSEMATSVSKLDTKVLESAPRTNPATALAGTISGLRVTQVSGQPGLTPDITLRGGTSWGGGGDPLVLINGVPGSFYALNSADIASIEVLKDAAATAIYGARAANGVILVTTKSGTPGKTKITYRSSYTTNHLPTTPNYLGAENYIRYNRIAIKNTQRIIPGIFQNFLVGPQAMGTGNNTTDSPFTTMFLTDANKYLLDHPGWLTMQDPVTGKTLIFRNNDMSHLFFQNSYSMRHDLSFSGGNEDGTYYLGLGYVDNEGLVIGSGFERFSANLNANYYINDNFKVSSNIIYAHSHLSGSYLGLGTVANRFVFQRAAGQPPTSRIFNTNPDGSVSNVPNPGTNSGFGNPLYYKDKFLNSNLEQRLTASVQFDWGFAENFNLMVRGSHFTVNNSNESFNKAFLNAGTLVTSRVASAEHDRTLRYQLTGIMRYANTFGKHNVDALIGVEYFRDNDFDLFASTRLSPTNLIHTLNAGAEANGVPSSFHTAYSIFSQFAQVNYVYDDRYIVGLSVRRDGTSRLATNKYDIFPGISVGWNLDNESFFQDSPLSSVISRIKPRVSYGVNGNIEVLSNYGVFGLYSETGVYDTQTGYGNSNLPVLNLTWERSTTLNFGLDLGLFNNRLNFLVDYYIRDVKDKLANLPLPLWTGFSSILTNNGILRTKGLELEFKANVLQARDWIWTIGSTFSTFKRYAKKLPDNGLKNNRQGGTEIYDPATGETKYVGGLQEGQRIGLDLVTAYIPLGVYNTEAELQEDAGRTVAFATDPEFQQLGDTRWKDINGDNIIDFRDRVVIGRTTPDFFGGITSNLSYKNFNLFIKLDYAVGHLLLNTPRLRGMSQVQGNQNWTTEILKTWTPENSDSNVPRFDFTDPQGNHTAGGGSTGSLRSSSARYWEEGDYLALRQVSLSYNFDRELFNGVFQNLKLYVTGTNLTYFSGYTGYSPEEAIYEDGVRGLDRGRFPMPKTFTIGISATF